MSALFVLMMGAGGLLMYQSYKNPQIKFSDLISFGNTEAGRAAGKGTSAVGQGASETNALDSQG